MIVASLVVLIYQVYRIMETKTDLELVVSTITACLCVFDIIYVLNFWGENMRYAEKKKATSNLAVN